jgi:hypothetical protein
MTRSSSDIERFAAMRQDADEVLRLRKRANQLYAERQPAGFDGLSDLLDRLLPNDRSVEERIARVLRFPLQDLKGLRASRLDPTYLARPAIASLAKAIGLDWETLRTLFNRDCARFADAGGGLVARSMSVQSDVEADLRAAWDRMEMDEATDL